MTFVQSRKRAGVRANASTLGPAAACLAALAASPAVAQTSAAGRESTLPETVVTGTSTSPLKPESASSPKFVKPILDTPQTITVIDRQLIQQRGVTTLTDALKSAPGITFALGENGVTFTGDTPMMRGFDSQYSIFVDGVRDTGVVIRDIFNIEAVEVVKGPSGSDNGRGAPSGYINMVSKQPQPGNFGTAQLLVGQGSRVRAAVDLNRELGLGAGAGLRLNAFTDKGDVVGRDHVDFERRGIAPSLAVGLGRSTRATLNWVHTEQDDRPDGGIPAIGLAGYDTLNIYPSATAIGSPTPVANPRPVDSGNFYGFLTDFIKVKSDMVTLRIDSEIAPGVRLQNTSRFARARMDDELTNPIILASTESPTSRRYLVVGDPAQPNTWSLGRFQSRRDQSNLLLTNQTNLSFDVMTGAVRHNVSTGVEFTHEQQRNVSYTFVDTQIGRANLYAPSVNDANPEQKPTGASTDGSTLTAAVYLFDTIDLSDQWQLSAGLRFERYLTEFTSVPATAVPPAAQATTTVLAKSDDLLTGKIGLVYKPVPEGSVYAFYASSQKPPGSDAFALNAGASSGATQAININGVNVSSQDATNLEAGVKWEVFNRRMLVSAAVFDTTNKNDLARADPTSPGSVIQYGKRSVRGVELAAAGAVTRALQLHAGLAYMKSSIDQAAVVAPGGVDAQTGAGLRYTPKLSLSSWVTYTLPFGLTLGGGARYLSSQNTAENNGTAPITGARRIPSYWVVDAMLAYEVSKMLSLQLNLNNVTDEFYMANMNFGRNRYTLGAPRNATLSANLSF